MYAKLFGKKFYQKTFLGKSFIKKIQYDNSFSNNLE